MTVEQLATAFLEAKARNVTERTMVDYRRDTTNWVLPWFGHRLAEEVDEGDVQGWADHMAERLAPKSVVGRHALLSCMFKWGSAKSRRLVSHKPCLETELPRRVRKPPKGTTVPEFRALLASAHRRNPDAADFILFLGETGWRFSEANALTVRVLEDDGVDVWVTVDQVIRLDASYRQIVAEDEAKSWAAFRRIRLPPESAAMVRRRLVGRGPGDLVLTNSGGRMWNQNTFLRETWPRIVADAELGDRKPTPHWLRHMHVAVMSAAGAQLQEIQRRLGHESIQTTIGTYGRMIGDVSDASLATAGALMSGKAHAPLVAPLVVGEIVALAEEPAGPSGD